MKRVPFATAIKAATTHQEDFVLPYVNDLRNVIDMDAIRAAGLKLGVDPLGGAARALLGADQRDLRPEHHVVNPKVDPTFSFMTVDHDGKIRMDCSSPYAMARLVGLKDQYRVAFANDPDSDRHGIVTPSAGLMNPNHYLAVAIRYLLTHRPHWPAQAAVGKTLVSSSMIDRVVQKLGRRLCEVPVGFKWFAPGLFDGSCCFGGEESAGASFLRRDGTVWTTDKDGPIMDLLAAEITARTGKDPGEHYRELTAEFGTPYYTRIDAPATPEQKAQACRSCRPRPSRQSKLAGEPITAKLTRAPGNNAPIGGLKVVAASGWFAARPSGTENIYKIYAESFKDEPHLEAIVAEAQQIVNDALSARRVHDQQPDADRLPGRRRQHAARQRPHPGRYPAPPRARVRRRVPRPLLGDSGAAVRRSGLPRLPRRAAALPGRASATICTCCRCRRSWSTIRSPIACIPRALDVLSGCAPGGATVILTDGDVVFQPRKVERSGLCAGGGRPRAHLHPQGGGAGRRRTALSGRALRAGGRQAAHPGGGQEGLGRARDHRVSPAGPVCARDAEVLASILPPT